MVLPLSQREIKMNTFRLDIGLYKPVPSRLGAPMLIEMTATELK
jgi:hypothetical protein